MELGPKFESFWLNVLCNCSFLKCNPCFVLFILWVFVVVTFSSLAASKGRVELPILKYLYYFFLVLASLLQYLVCIVGGKDGIRFSGCSQTSGYSEVCIVWVHFPVLSLSALILSSLSSASLSFFLILPLYLCRAFLITALSSFHPLFYPFSTSVISFLLQEVPAPPVFHNILPVPLSTVFPQCFSPHESAVFNFVPKMFSPCSSSKLLICYPSYALSCTFTFTWLLSGHSLQPPKFPVQNKISKLSKLFFFKVVLLLHYEKSIIRELRENAFHSETL